MVHVVAGTDSYGRVKVVAGTPVVTRFAMLQLVPLYPLNSYYKTGADVTKFTGIPLIASTETTIVQGVPLARIDAASVIMAYLRALFAVMSLPGVIVGALWLFARQERPDEFVRIVTTVTMTSLVIGVVGGLLTYAIPLISARERDIRQCCGELLGSAVDPALTPPETSELLVDIAREQYDPDDLPRAKAILGLVIVRARIAQEIDVDRMEIKTDELLAYLSDGN